MLPDKIGVMGFSAGGHLASTAATHFDSGNPQPTDPIDRASSRPDIAVLAYPRDFLHCTGLGKENCFQVLLKSADGTPGMHFICPVSA
jgi:dienelactone hydrolase